MERFQKHLLMVLGGIGLCQAGQIIGSWTLVIETETIHWPFYYLGIASTAVGFLCCASVLLLQLDRYKKKPN